MVVIVILGIRQPGGAQLNGQQRKSGSPEGGQRSGGAGGGAGYVQKLDNSRYPNSEQGLQALVSRPTAEPQARNYPEGGYIRRLPQDPWGNDYQLLSPGQHGQIDVFSVGPDECRIPTTILATGLSGKNSADSAASRYWK